MFNQAYLQNGEGRKRVLNTHIFAITIDLKNH